MKRLLFFTTMFWCSLLTFAQFEGTVSDSQGVHYTANDDASTCYVSGWHNNYNGITTIKIPEEIQGRTVTRIADEVFANTSVIHKVTIPNSVTSIGDWAFYNCRGLISVTIGNSVTSIGNYAFEKCSALTGNLEIPNSVTSIGNRAFPGCTGLTSVTIGNNVTSIGNDAFAGCTGLTGNLEIPNSVTTIGDYAFVSCSGLTSVTIGNSVTSIGDYAFGSCSSLITVIINCKEVGKWFERNEYIQEVIMGDEVTSICDEAFAYCHGLTSVTIGNSVMSIGDWAFGDCSSLTSVEIPNSVTTIGDGAFADCSSLTSMVVSSGNTTYDSRDNCNAIIETATNTLISGCKNTLIPNSVTSIGEYAFYLCTGLTSVEIPNSVTSIGEYAFRYCTGLTSVTIGNSVTSIGDGAFAYCRDLTSVVVSSGNPKYDSRNNCNAIIETATNTLISGSKNTVIPNSVTSIGDYAFSRRSGLTSVMIPNSVTSIGKSAFSECSGLTSVTIGNSVTSIGVRAFDQCHGLISITIPNSVTSIGNEAFMGTAWYSNQPDGLVYAGKVAYQYQGTMPDNTHITLLEGTLGIAESAFIYCSGLTSVEIPNSVTSIGSGAFGGRCFDLKSVTLKNENPAEIDSSTFSNRANATLYVPAGSKDTYEAADYWKEFKEIIEMDIQPIDTGETVDFGSDIDGDTDLDGNIVGDIYYVISNDDGGYDVAEGCIVVTTPTDDSTIDGQDIFGEDFQNNYTGIVLKVPAGRGTITVEAQTIGTMVLKVKIGTAAPVTMELDGRLKVSFPYDVTEPTYVYIYGGSNATAAPDMAGSAAGGALKLYGIEVAPGSTGIEPIDHSTLNIEHYYTLDGRMLQGKPTQKGVYIVNGHKVVIK